ncbi:unnamed protein product, partial [Ilex paraguariensis]
MGTGVSRKAKDVGPSSNEPMKKKKNDQLEEIRVRNVTCERQVNRNTLGPREVMVRTTENHDLHFLFDEVKGYLLPL